MNLDSFINKCITEVRQAKTKGKKGKAARASLRQSAEELTAIKARRKAMLIEIAEAKWISKSLVLYSIDTVCPCCNTTESHPCSVHLEQVHITTKAKRSHELPDFIPPRDFALKRVRRTWETRFQVCMDCFTRPGPETIPRPFRDCKPDEMQVQEEYKKAEVRYYARFWRGILPKHLLLTHNPEITQ